VVLSLTVNKRPQQVVLFSGCVRIHTTQDPETLPLSDVTHASVARKQPWWGLSVAMLMGALAFAGALEPGAETALAVLMGLVAAFYGASNLGGGSLELRAGKRILHFPLTRATLVTANTLVAAIHRHNPATARPTLTIPRLLREALIDLFSSDRGLAGRVTGRLAQRGTVDVELAPNALRVTRRMAAWNVGFGVGLPVVCLALVQQQWPVALMGTLIRGALVAPVACVLGLVLQARLMPRFKDWLVR
jgi:hypothetical protein